MGSSSSRPGLRWPDSSRDSALTGIPVVSCPMSVHQALLFRQWTTRLTLLLHTGPHPSSEEAALGLDPAPYHAGSVSTSSPTRPVSPRFRACGSRVTSPIPSRTSSR